MSRPGVSEDFEVPRISWGSCWPRAKKCRRDAHRELDQQHRLTERQANRISAPTSASRVGTGTVPNREAAQASNSSARATASRRDRVGGGLDRANPW